MSNKIFDAEKDKYFLSNGLLRCRDEVYLRKPVRFFSISTSIAFLGACNSNSIDEVGESGEGGEAGK